MALNFGGRQLPQSVYGKLFPQGYDPTVAQQNLWSMPQTNVTTKTVNPEAPDMPPPASGSSTGGDFWSQYLQRIGQYGADTSQIAANKEKLAPMMNAALAYAPWHGAEGILNYLNYNPNKGRYAALSYLTGTPYYDRGDDPNQGKLFKVPGFDYGTVDDNWSPYAQYGLPQTYWT